MGIHYCRELRLFSIILIATQHRQIWKYECWSSGKSLTETSTASKINKLDKDMSSVFAQVRFIGGFLIVACLVNFTISLNSEYARRKELGTNATSRVCDQITPFSNEFSSILSFR